MLAAGAGRRFGKGVPKLLAPVGGEPLVLRALAPALDAGLDEVVVVTGAYELADVLPSSVTVLRNEDWEAGQATSLQVALDWCGREGHSSVVVGLGDLLGVPAAAWRDVATAPGGPVVVATYRGRRGHPVRLDAEVWPLLPVEGEEGARALFLRRPELVTELACEGDPHDVDTREDLRRWS